MKWREEEGKGTNSKVIAACGMFWAGSCSLNNDTKTPYKNAMASVL
jgi:hypothetical protein